MVDSFVVDPHKWLFAPFDCAALVYREPNLAKAVHTQDASYLDVLHTDAPEEWNPSDYAYHLTRRARGLPLWFSLAVNGTDAYRDAVETVLSTTQEAADLISRSPHLELVRRPELSVVLFRRRDWDRGRYESWSARLLDDQIGFVVPTTWEGESVARLALLPSGHHPGHGGRDPRHHALSPGRPSRPEGGGIGEVVSRHRRGWCPRGGDQGVFRCPPNRRGRRR